MGISGRRMAAFVQQGKQKLHRDGETPKQDDEKDDDEKTIDRSRKQPSDDELVDQAEQDIEEDDVPEQLADLVDGLDYEDGPPDWAKDRDLWDRAVSVVEPGEEETQDRFEQPMLVVVLVYEALGGEIEGYEPDDDPEED